MMHGPINISIDVVSLKAFTRIMCVVLLESSTLARYISMFEYITRSLSTTKYFKENRILATVKSRNPSEQQNANLRIFILLDYVTILSVTNNITQRG